MQSLAFSLPSSQILTLSQLPRRVRPGQRLLGRVLFPDILHLASCVSSRAPDQPSLHRVSCGSITSMTSC